MLFNSKNIFLFGFNFCISLLLADSKNKPNIILFMADDMGLGDSSAYQNISLIPGAKPITKTLKTPNLKNSLNRELFLRMPMHLHLCAVPLDILF
jgi:hypothetical protein